MPTMNHAALNHLPKLYRAGSRSALLALSLVASTANAVFIDGEGSFALRAESRTRPGMSPESKTHQAIDQHFRFKGELRANDRTSMFLEFRLFDDPRQAYFGDVGRPEDCTIYQDVSGNTIGSSSQASGSGCVGQHQNTAEPAYEPYRPYVTQAYVQYAFDYCLLTVGRRPRDWGLGIFLNAGTGPFDTAYSVYDGATCDINLQKSQTLGISFGYDKLSESGPSVELNSSHVGSATNRSEDLDQYFFSIQFDNRAANAGSSFTRQVGMYFANVLGDDKNTDIKFADLYTGFFFADLAVRNELLFRLGKSADPNWARYGGRTSVKKDVVQNKVDSIGVAGEVSYTLMRSGAFVGPAEYRQGNAKSSEVFFGYAYAPGEQNGYRKERPTDASPSRAAGSGNTARAMAFHRNFKPALLLFNEHPEVDQLRVDGVFDPGRVMNASVFNLGFRYESLETGNFEARLVTASLVAGIPKDVYTLASSQAVRPIGFAGKSLGYELDLKYDRTFGKDLSVGVAGAFALPGDAWKVIKNEAAKSSFMVEAHAVFRF